MKDLEYIQKSYSDDANLKELSRKIRNKTIEEVIDKLSENTYFDILGNRANLASILQAMKTSE